MTSSDEKFLRIPMKDHLRDASQPTDVIFVFHVFQGERKKQRKHAHDVVFPAHRDRLLTASPYFESLLTGEWKQTDEIAIEDCQPGAFRIMLRWIYGDEEVVESIRASTYVATLLVADRFGMQDLASRLVGLAEQLLAVMNSFFYKILDMLEHWQIGCANELTEKCLNYLDKNAAALVKHNSFLRISHKRLMEILARNSLRIYEIDLYCAAIKWARAQLKRANKRRTRRAIREALGEALFLIRFPRMHPQEFTSGPAMDSILSAEEKLAIYGRIHSAGPTSCAFSAEPRTGASTLPLCDFTPTYCQKCGTRLHGEICPECGCVYNSSVECDICDRRIFMNDEAFAITICHPCGDCWAVAYLCSCGAPNATNDIGRLRRCRRCGLKAWRCGNDGSVMEGACKCDYCKHRHAGDYSDDDDEH